MSYKVEITGEDLGVDYRDSGKWRCYELSTFGRTYEQLMDNATIFEIDQDGGELDSYSIDNAENEVYNAAQERIKDALVEIKTENTMAKIDQLIDAIRKPEFKEKL